MRVTRISDFCDKTPPLEVKFERRSLSGLRVPKTKSVIAGEAWHSTSPEPEAESSYLQPEMGSRSAGARVRCQPPKPFKALQTLVIEDQDFIYILESMDGWVQGI